MGREMKLGGKVAVITGGSSGIGRASARLFAREGAKIAVADIDEDSGKETLAMVKADGGESCYIRTDVTLASEVQNLVRAIKDRFGKIDIVLNSAGVNMNRIPVETIGESLWDQVYAIDVKSIFLVAKYVVPEMKKAGGGVIINMGSMAGVRPHMCYSAYSSAKGAVNALTKALAMELAPNHIRVNCINPGPTDTPLWRKVAADFNLSTVPLGHLAKPEDIAYAALFLASEESAMITGMSVNVDGGRGI